MLKSTKSFSKSQNSSKKDLTEGNLKSLELEALSLIDTNASRSKLLIEECLRSLEKSQISILENIYIHYLHCDVCIRVNHTELALSSGEKALSLIESFGDHIDVLAYHARTLQLLGIVYSTLSLYSKAVLVYQKLLSILDSYEIPNIDRFYVFERLADSLVAAQRFGQAKVFLNALVENRKTVHWLLQYSRVWISEKDFSKAKLALQEAYELSPSLSVGTCEVLSKLAWVEMQLLEYDQALLHFANCTNIIKAAGMPASEETLWIHSQLGQLHYAKKSYEEALKIFKTSKLLCEELHIKNAEYGNILLHIGKIKSMQNNLQEALNYFKSADKVLKNIDKQSSVEAVLSILGVYLAQGNTIKAWEVLKEIETQNYSPMVNATAENELGNLLREFGYNSEAMKYYNSILKGWLKLR